MESQMSSVEVVASGRVVKKNVGGNSRYVRELYPRLLDYGVNVEVAGDGIEGKSHRSARYALMESLVWPLFPPNNAQVLHFPADTGALLKASTPIVATVHGLATLHQRGVRKPLPDRVWRQRVSSNIRAATRVVTVSQSSADDIIRATNAAADKIEVIHHGIDHERFNPQSVRPSPVARLGLKETYFLYVGNIDPRKNIPAICAAAGRIFEDTGIETVVAGAPAWDSSELMSLLSRSPGVRYLGRVPEEDLVTLMGHALAFCFPSFYEGFGFPVLEAMAVGVPVICSDRGSLREVASGAALVMEEPSGSELERNMRTVIQSEGLRDELRAAGLIRAKEFQWAKSAALHADVFVGVAR